MANLDSLNTSVLSVFSDETFITDNSTFASNGTVPGGSVYIAPSWVYALTAVVLSLIGVCGIIGNVMAVLVYIADRAVSNSFTKTVPFKTQRLL